MSNRETDEQELVEVKGVTLVEDGIALFPDAPTKRGARHVRELGEAVAKGWKANVVLIIKRNDAKSFKPNVKMDPKFAEEFKLALEKGVNFIAVICNYEPIFAKKINIVKEVPILTDF
jgi:sugar fermentation stimulation protein A